MSQRYIVKEFDTFTRNVIVENKSYHTLPEKTFDQLENFILNTKSEGSLNGDIMEFMSISSKRGIGKVIRVKNYVGLLTMKDGTEIEILPKLYTEQQEGSEMVTKRVFLHMLRFLLDLPYKTIKMSNVHIEKFTILEIFIRMFIDQVFVLVKRGLKSSYIEHQDNEYFYKGKLKFSQHLKHNIAHKERFFIEYDLLSVNRAENKLIKTTLELLSKVTRYNKNKKDIRILLASFETVDNAVNIDQEFDSITPDRNMKEYNTILSWCKVFLKNESFTTFTGQGVAYSLLFPMEKVFEAYVSGYLKKKLDLAIYSIKTQDRSFHLFDHPKRFHLRPDIVVYRNNQSVILDTKWKLLDDKPQYNYGISQADMYQSYAYHKKYTSNLVMLLYPWRSKYDKFANPIIFSSHEPVTVHIGFIDLINIDKSIENLITCIEKAIYTN